MVGKKGEDPKGKSEVVSSGLGVVAWHLGERKRKREKQKKRKKERNQVAWHQGVEAQLEKELGENQVIIVDDDEDQVSYQRSWSQ